MRSSVHYSEFGTALCGATNGIVTTRRDDVGCEVCVSIMIVGKPKTPDRIAKLEAEIEVLRAALKALKVTQLDMEPGMWGIRCIEDHNLIIDEALDAARSPKDAPK